MATPCSCWLARHSNPRMTSLLATGMPRLELTETLEQFLSENLDARRGAKLKAYEDALGAPWRYARPESPAITSVQTPSSADQL